MGQLKHATRSRLYVEIGCDVDLCEKIEFRFKQGNVVKDFVYPSDTAVRRSARAVDLIWTAADKAQFKNGKMSFDSRITLKDSPDQPDTGDIQTLFMSPSLFDEEE